MIAHLHGELARIESDYVVIDVHGVGYKVHLPLAIISQLPAIGDEVKLLICTIVKEDSFTLYGFLEEAQQSLFELLLTVSGVGPKVALNILSVLAVEQVVGAISGEHYQELNRVGGVGTKTAQRIVLELKDKMTTLVWARAVKRPLNEDQRTINDAIEGLVALGYNRNDAQKAAEEAQHAIKDKRDTGNIVRAALKYLSRG
ncbi:MAG: Holliday junction branch migration protein RuvA [Armatimonadetes bacterium]|nr:Holliday junction branch migration protein RuvA [Armatimonadota bacterium]